MGTARADFSNSRPPGAPVHRVCFVANYSKTEFFGAIARELIRSGIGICWISVNERLHHWLRERFGSAHLLLIDTRCADRPFPARGEYKINELIYGDRALRHAPALGRRYLVNIQQPVYDFLAAERPRFVFGELTWAHELLIRRLIAQSPELHAEYLTLAPVRIPNGRFAFFRGEAEDEMLEGPDGELRPTGAADRAVEIEKPAYLGLNDRTARASRGIRARLARMKRFLTRENIVAHDPTLIHNDLLRLKLRVLEEINKETYRRVRKCRLADLDGRHFVFVALHKQPEASIDVLGRYYENQYQNILNVWRTVPTDWLVVIKEHTTAIGDRGMGFFRRLQALPNVLVADERIDSHDLIRRAEVVFTVSGTVAYEAVLLGRPALTMVRMFFSGASSCRSVTVDELRRCASIRDLIPPAHNEAEAMQDYVYRHSFPGLISDPVSNPACMDTRNVEQVAGAIAWLMRSQLP